MTRSKSSARWLKEHFSDTYVKRAQEEGYRGRAAYKLLALDEKHKLLKPKMTVVDLGAAPGSWSQVCVQRLKSTGKIFALDILAMDPIPEVSIYQGDFTDNAVFEALQTALAGESVDLVLSDMAPNLSGNPVIDQPRSMLLNEMALEFAGSVLKKDGTFLTKAFHGTGFDAFLKILRQQFKSVHICKPDASRTRSREQYLLGKGFHK